MDKLRSSTPLMAARHDVVRAETGVSITLTLPQATFDALLERMREEVVSALDARSPRPELFTIDDLCAALQVSRATLARMRTEGLPTIMVCDSPRFRLDAVLEWLEQR